MAKNKIIKIPYSKKQSLKPLSFVGFLCSIAILSGCGGESVPRIPAPKTSPVMEEAIQDSTSHMQSEDEDNVVDADEIESAAAPQFTPRSVSRSKLNPKNMFGVDLRTNEERLDRLERAVQDMRHEFDMVTPSIRRLMAVEGDIQQLIGELQKLSDDPDYKPARKAPVAAVPQVQARAMPQQLQPKASAPATAKQLQTKAPPPVQNGTASVFDIRIGEHPGKTRIVLDVNTKTAFTADVDNGEKIMVVELPNANWATSTSQSFAKSPFISSYKVESTGNGQLLIFQLKRDATISYKADIGGAGSSRRIVIDLSGS